MKKEKKQHFLKSRKEIMAAKLKSVAVPEPKKKEEKIDEAKVDSIIFEKAPAAAKLAPAPKEKEAPKKKAETKPAPAAKPAPKPGKAAKPLPAPKAAEDERPHRKPPERKKHIRSFTISDPAYDPFNDWCKSKTISMSEILERVLIKFNQDDEFRKTVVSRIYEMG